MLKASKRSENLLPVISGLAWRAHLFIRAELRNSRRESHLAEAPADAYLGATSAAPGSSIKHCSPPSLAVFARVGELLPARL